MGRKEAVTAQVSSAERLHSQQVDIFKRTDAALVNRESFANSVERFVLAVVGLQEEFVCSSPESGVHRQVKILLGCIAEKAGSVILRIGAKQLGPIAGWAVD